MEKIREPNGLNCINCTTPLVGRQRKWCKKSCRTRHNEKKEGKAPPSFLTAKPITTTQRKINQLIKEPNKAIFRAPSQEIKHWEYSLKYWEKVYYDARNGVYSMATLTGGGIGVASGEDAGEKIVNGIIGGMIGKAIDNWRQKDTMSHALSMINQCRGNIERLKKIQSFVASTNKLKEEKKVVKINALSNDIPIERTDSYTMMNAEDLSKLKRVTYKLDGKWKYFWGDEIEQGFSALIYGSPKAGKSHFSVQLGEYLRQFGNVAYFAAEEGTAKTFENKTKRWNAKFPVVYNINGTKGIDDYLKNHNPKFIFLDSITRLGIGYESLKFYVDEYPDKSWFYISQSTKTNGFRGSQEIKHLVDTIIEVHNGVAYQDGRESSKTELQIFDTDL